MKSSVLSACGLFISVFVVSCGGSSGGSSSDGDSSSSSLTEINPTTINKLSTNAADALPGCTYNSVNSPSLRANKTSVWRLFRDTFNKVLNEQQGYSNSGSYIVARSNHVVDEITEGDCPSQPGFFRTTGTDIDGSLDVEIAYSSYCTGDATENTVVNGVVKVKSISDNSGSELIPISTALSTLCNGLEIIAMTEEETIDLTV